MRPLPLRFRRWLQLEHPLPRPFAANLGTSTGPCARGGKDPHHHGLMRHILISFVARLVSRLVPLTHWTEPKRRVAPPSKPFCSVCFLHSWSNGITNISSDSIKSETHKQNIRPKRSTYYLSYTTRYWTIKTDKNRRAAVRYLHTQIIGKKQTINQKVFISCVEYVRSGRSGNVSAWMGVSFPPVVMAECITSRISAGAVTPLMVSVSWISPVEIVSFMYRENVH